MIHFALDHIWMFKRISMWIGVIFIRDRCLVFVVSQELSMRDFLSVS